MTSQNHPDDNKLDKPLEVIILAAGHGKRMRSALPKVLHRMAGRTLLQHVVDAARTLSPGRIHVVIGHGADAVRTATDAPVSWVEQIEQKGTAHAVAQALPLVDDEATVLVTYGDVPLISPTVLERCAAAAEAGALALVTAEFDDPAELGRIVRDGSGRVRAIVEYADATDEERRIAEINSGILALNAALMKTLIDQVEPHNAQGEYYLTDLVGLAVDRNLPVETVVCEDPADVIGINDRVQLAQVERIFQARVAEGLMRAGVTIADPSRLDIRGQVTAGEDCFIDVNVVLEGQVRLGRGVRIGPGSVVIDSELGDGVTVNAHTVIEGCVAAAGCMLGPFTRIRPGTELAEDVKIGNFVEAKKARLGRGTKASHLSYLGDATLGEECNVGAGTVTCNYDGIDKHPTTIGDRVFVGTNTTLVAPLAIESGAYVAAGSTITDKVGEGDLAVGRARQRNISGWTRPDQRRADQKKEGNEDEAD